MTDQEISELDEGDVVRHLGTGQRYVVLANYGNRVTAVDVADVTHPPEWEVVVKRKVKKVYRSRRVPKGE